MSKTIAFDQSLGTTGVAVFEGEELIEFFSFHIPGGKPLEERLGLIWKQLNEIASDADFVVFEETYKNEFNTDIFRKLCYVQAVFLLWCYWNQKKYLVISPPEWRKILGGGFGRKREEQKKHAIELVYQKYKKECSSDEADAICLGWAGIKKENAEKSAF